MKTEINQTQLSLDFHWTPKHKNRQVWLKPKIKMSGWKNEWIAAYLTHLGKGQAYNGGRIAVFHAGKVSKHSYLMIDTYSELQELFKIKC